MSIPTGMVWPERVANQVEVLCTGIFQLGFRLIERQPELGHHGLCPGQCLDRSPLLASQLRPLPRDRTAGQKVELGSFREYDFVVDVGHSVRTDSGPSTFEGSFTFRPGKTAGPAHCGKRTFSQAVRADGP